MLRKMINPFWFLCWLKPVFTSILGSKVKCVFFAQNDICEAKYFSSKKLCHYNRKQDAHRPWPSPKYHLDTRTIKLSLIYTIIQGSSDCKPAISICSLFHANGRRVTCKRVRGISNYLNFRSRSQTLYTF